MLIVPKNWQSFQQYKDRSPPWIKLHRKLLDDFDFQCLPLASKALAPMLWLLASEHRSGEIDATPARIAFRLRWSVEDVGAALTPLIEKGFFEVLQRDSKPQAERLQSAIPEREAETELETEKTTSPRSSEKVETSPPPQAPIAALAVGGEVSEERIHAIRGICIAKRIPIRARDEPQVRQFAAEGVTDQMLKDAIACAQESNPPPATFGFAYLVPIIADLRTGRRRPTEKRGADAIPIAIANLAAKAANGPH